MKIQWNELLQVFGATMLSTILLVTLFSFGVRGLAKQPDNPEEGGESGNVSEAGPVLCFVLCLAIAAYGVYLIAVK